MIVPVNRHCAEYLSSYLAISPQMLNLERGLREGDARMSFTFFDQATQLQTFAELISSHEACDGLVLLSSLVDEPLARLLVERQFPHVGVESSDERMGINTVCADEMGGIRKAVTHLQELGIDRIGYVGCRQGRYARMVGVVTEAGLTFDEHCFCHVLANSPAYRPEEWEPMAAAAFEPWMAQHSNLPQGFICQNDYVAMGVISVLRRHGLEAGRDIAVVGYDNIEQRSTPPVEHPILTTIDNPIDEIGYQCAQRLLEQMNGKQTPIIHQRIPTKLIIRQSTQPRPELQIGSPLPSLVDFQGASNR